MAAKRQLRWLNLGALLVKALSSLDDYLLSMGVPAVVYMAQ